MSEKMVKVTIRAGYTGHHHKGSELKPGDSFEVTEEQAKWLESCGAIEPMAKSSKSRTKSISKDAKAEESDPTSPEAD